MAMGYLDPCISSLQVKVWHGGVYKMIREGVKIYILSIACRKFDTECILVTHNFLHTQL